MALVFYTFCDLSHYCTASTAKHEYGMSDFTGLVPNPSSSPRSRRPRLRDRLGIDISSQSVVLPPLVASSYSNAASPRHGSLRQLQEDERHRVVTDFHQRIETTRALGVDLAPLMHAVSRALQLDDATGTATGTGDDVPAAEQDEQDCFSTAKRVITRIATRGQAPFLSQFLHELVVTIERLAHDKRQLDAKRVAAMAGVAGGAVSIGSHSDLPRPQDGVEADHAVDDGDDDAFSVWSSSSESSQDQSDDDDDSDDGNAMTRLELSSSATSSLSTAATTPTPTPTPPLTTTASNKESVRLAPTRDAVFRTTLRSRVFPVTRVPSSESVYTTSAYMPFDHLKTPPDLAALRMQGHNDVGAAEWRMVLFPTRKPRWHDHDQLTAFLQWAAQTTQKHQPSSGLVLQDAATTTTTRTRIQTVLAAKELICYELSRFVFDKCPTTARFLHGLFLEIVDVALRALASAERDQQIMEQRHRNVQLELTRLHDKRSKVQQSLAALETTLATRQQRLLRERELIIRKRKKLNLILSSDQIVIRSLTALIHHAQELAEDASQNQLQTQTQNQLQNQNLVVASDERVPPFTAVDEMIALVLEKYESLSKAAQRNQAIAVSTTVSSPPPQQPQPPTLRRDGSSMMETEQESRELIVLDTNEIASAMDEYKATLHRLSRMLSTKSPDSSIGWDAQELWDQALFIPPHEDVQDLERDVQRLCLQVEDYILSQRQRRAMEDSVRDVAVQTEISACLPGRKYSQQQPQFQRWRARPFAHEPPAASSSKTPTIPTWNWRRLLKKKRKPRHQQSGSTRTDDHTMSATTATTATGTTTTTTTTIAMATSATSATMEEDHRGLLATVVPAGFRAFIHSIPDDYVPHQLSLHSVHTIISFLLNGVWMLVQEDFHRPARFSTVSPWLHASSSSSSSSDARLIPLTTIHEYIYRIHLQHFHVERVVTSRLLDLLVSASRLDTQSCKIQLFCRLLGLPGVAAFPSDGFWFVLRALHVLQRCCTTTGGYFLLDGDGDNEFVPQASATEALSQLFAGSSNDVLKRLRLKLSGLASVYGAVWIPAYSILTFAVDEWQAGQHALRLLVEDKLFVEHASETDPFTGSRIFTNEHNVVTFSEFLRGFAILQLHVNRSEALHAYRQLLRDSTGASSSSSCSTSVSASAAPRIDRHRFYVNWMEMILHAVNVAQQQMLRPQNAASSSAAVAGPVFTKSSGKHGNSNAAAAGVGPGVQLGAIADAMATAHQQLALKFLLISWEQMKPEVIRRLDHKFNDVGQQMRLVQQMDAAVTRHLQHQQQQQQQHDSHGDNGAWRSFHQLIQVAYTDPSR